MFFKDQNEKLTQENKEIHLRYLEHKEHLDELKNRMKFFTKVNFLSLLMNKKALYFLCIVQVLLLKAEEYRNITNYLFMIPEKVPCLVECTMLCWMYLSIIHSHFLTYFYWLFLFQENDIDVSELSEALMLIKVTYEHWSHFHICCTTF